MTLRSAPPLFDRRAVANEAMHASIEARVKAKMDLVSPICVYALCQAHGVRVRFDSINMEGMYQRGSPPRIYLSSLRPLTRRTYSCAHELGHHVLGHGSSIDELQEDAQVRPWDDAKEFGANTFAGFALMPALGLRRAFVTRGWKPETADPAEIYRIACEFGVGYLTMVTHLLYGAGMIGRARAAVLQRASPRAIRAEILGAITPAPLIVADQFWSSPTIDAEVKHLLLLPPDAQASSDIISPVADLPGGRLFEAARPGIVQVTRPGTSWAAFARIARTAYAGRAEFRHLEDEADD